jgi:hypothetical protein
MLGVHVVQVLWTFEQWACQKSNLFGTAQNPRNQQIQWWIHLDDYQSSQWTLYSNANWKPDSVTVSPQDDGYSPSPVLSHEELSHFQACQSHRCPKTDFDHFQTTMFDPSQPIVPWHRPRLDSHLSAKECAHANWNKTIKPLKSDYGQFKDEMYWFQYREDFTTVARSHSLYHTININFTPNLHQVGQTRCFGCSV